MTPHPVRRLAAVALAVCLSACGPAATPGGPGRSVERVAGQGATWARVPDIPLSPRTDPVLAWTGSEVLVVGGNTGSICPPYADCTTPTELASDGVALDPATGTWRQVAPAPVGVWNSWGGGHDSVVVGDLLVVRGTRDTSWRGYDVVGDAWSTLSPPPGFEGRLVASGDRLWARSGSRILSWDPVADAVRLEASYAPQRPLQDTQLFVTPAGPVLAGVRYGEAAPDEPTLTQVDVPDGAGGWRRFVTGQVGWLGHWDGRRLVGVEPGEVDGGEVNAWDRAYPFAGTLDPRTGDWQPLDVPRADLSYTGWRVSAAAGSRIVSLGHLLDTRTGAWVALDRPDSGLDHNLAATWADQRLFVLGGVDQEAGFESPAAPEAWWWTPPA
ncbi:hypothetical protein GCM10011376_11870 [Nocardioides flavus (ex Wang et al. 2016)]|uniref:Galactose oxidase, central domain n=1 Tax=Nocardioides flavus (ex Wang et al. 2016) TaxID=2058780 RepID=A0ABQ3HJF7_9ACTN|nr:hypothetical protein [Nocardioides flavus (ex Wang et al. 2016)]GHE16577.1 hypothetical protein GCM10011376_11870 [Nocardioides flavus (ex Wang et al. 2016)]